MGSVGVVFHKPLQYGSAKVSHIKFSARDHTVQIGDTISLNANAIEKMTSENGSISITRRRRKDKTQHPAVTICLENVNLHFAVKFDGEHLDLFWHKPVESSTSHGIIGELCSKKSNHSIIIIIILPRRLCELLLGKSGRGVTAKQCSLICKQDQRVFQNKHSRTKSAYRGSLPMV